MKQFIVFTISLFLTSCCCQYDEDDFAFSERYNKLLKPYTKGKIIYFSNASGDLDTIMVSNIDTIQQCGCFMVGNGRSVSVKIKHLPVNHWIAGTEWPQDKPPNILDQTIIGVGKSPNDTGWVYSIGIHYRYFMGNLSDTSTKYSDNRFEKSGIQNYWVIANQIAEWEQYKKDSTIILKAYWTEKYGLTGYDLRNGQNYILTDSLSPQIQGKTNSF